MSSLDPVRASPSSRILVVEDEYLLAVELVAILNRAGFDVVGPFSDCRKAIESLDAEWPDAAVLDMDLNGETSELLAQALSRAGIPFCILSGYVRSFAKASMFENVPVLSKPVDASEMLACMRRMLR